MFRKNLLSAPAMMSFLLVILSLGASSLYAQSFYGGITGTVTDSTGAVLPGATITVLNLGTNEVRTAQTGSAGEYRFVNLVPANYKLDVQVKSFKRFEVQSVAVQVDNTVKVDAQLQLGSAAETVTVTSQAPLLQTESGTLGNEVDAAVVAAMPLNGRNTMNLIGLSPGVVATTGASGSAGFNSGNRTNAGNWGGYQIGGGFTNENALYIDGATDNVLGASLTALIPSQDAVQEFRVESSVPSAEYGRFGGGAIAMTTKSGTNGFHGTAYEYVRNTILNAGNFITKDLNLPKTAFHQNQYGAAVGGPIKKDKAFFFVLYEKFSLRQASPASTNVPSLNQRAGIFTKKITDPSGTCAKKSPATNGIYSPTAGVYQIPTVCFDATSLVQLGYFPAPNSTANPTYNFVATPVIGDDATQYDARIDYSLSEKQRLFGRYTQWSTMDIGQNEFSNYGGFATGFASPTNNVHSVVLGDTYTINSTTIADARISYTRFVTTNNAPSLGAPNLAQFGPAYASLSSLATYKTLPTPIITGTDGIFSLTAMANVAYDWYENYGITSSVTKITGVHVLKFGGEAIRRTHDGTGHFHAPGYSTYTNTTTGDEVASFLLGEFTNDVAQTQLPVTTFNFSYGLYGTDTWKVNRNLTLNLGLRYELPGGLAEKKDRTSVFLPNVVDPVTNYTGANVLVNSPLYPSRSVEPTHYTLFSPRVSFAQNLPGSTVLRGGFALTYLPPDIPIATQAYSSPVNAAITTSTNSAVPVYFASDPFPAVVGQACTSSSCPQAILQPVGRSNPNFSKTFLGQSITVVVPTSNYPYMSQWDLTVGKQWKGDLSLEIDYAGAKGTHLAENVAYSMDQVPTGSVAGLQAMETSLIAAGSTQAAAANATIAYGKTLEPFPQYQNLLDGARYTGSSTYNALYVVAQKRFHSGGLINVNYTWSKMLTDTDVPNSNSTTGVGGTGYPQDYNNHRADKSLAAYDLPQRLVINYVLNLPFGKGQRFGSGVTGVADKLVSGWAANGITTVQSGFPLVVQYNGNFLSKNLNAGTIRPNYVAGCNKNAGVPSSTFQRFLTNSWFNAACFTYPGDFSFGNEPRVDPTLKAEGLTNFDFSLSKLTTIKDSVNLQFRAEAFNLFNHPYLPSPGSIMAGSFYNSLNVSNSFVNPRLIQLSLRLNF